MKGAIRSTFFSRRNRVCLLETASGLVVEKVFPSSAEAEREAAVYRLLEGSVLPHAAYIKREGPRLYLSFVPGADYVSLLMQQEESGPDLRVWDALSDWLISFYALSSLVIQDTNLRNFLWHEDAGLTIGLDFESCASGEPEEMLAQVCAFVLLYDPAGTPVKRQIASHLSNRAVEQGLCSKERFSELMERELHRIRQRRKEKQPAYRE